MQKISSYLYPNRVMVIADVTPLSTRWNIVYQNKIKIYQGVDNVLTIDVKNSDQKRIDISGMNIKMSITDVNNQNLTVVPVVPTSTRGLALVTIPADQLSYIDPQFLRFTIYKINSNLTKTILYADTQFGAVGNLELVGSALAVDIEPRYITRFYPNTDNKSDPAVTTYYSDAVEILKPNLLTEEYLDAIYLNFINNGLSGQVTVEFTKDAVISNGTDWEQIDQFQITPGVTSLSKVYEYPVYARDHTWARVYYLRNAGNEKNLSRVTISFDSIIA